MSTSPPETLGQLVAKYRNRLNFTQAELAERADVSERTIQDIEGGRNLTPHRDTVRRLVTALELSRQERSEIETAVSNAAAARRSRAAQHNSPDPEPPPQAQRDTITIVLPKQKLWAIGAVGFLILIVGAFVVAILLRSRPEGPRCLPPDPNLEGVTLYELPCYGGGHLTLTESDLDLCDNPLDPALGRVDPCFTAPSWNDVASSAWISSGYRVEFHLNNPIDADDAMLVYKCQTAIPDFSALSFPNGESLDDSVSRVVIQTAACQ